MTKKIKLPISDKEVRTLAVGDEVLLSGPIVTARDAIHLHLHNGNKSPYNLSGLLVYHAGPVVKKTKTGHTIEAIGPTTSMREEPYTYSLMQNHGVKMIMGKGGMGELTQKALVEFGGVYLHAVGGAAQLLSTCVKKVNNVFFLDEFGVPEAMWVLEVKDFPATVTMDSHGNSLHQSILESSRKALKKALTD